MEYDNGRTLVKGVMRLVVIDSLGLCEGVLWLKIYIRCRFLRVMDIIVIVLMYLSWTNFILRLVYLYWYTPNWYGTLGEIFVVCSYIWQLVLVEYILHYVILYYLVDNPNYTIIAPIFSGKISGVLP